MKCSECRTFWESQGRDPNGPLSRAAAEYVHWWHRPMHASQVGANRRRLAAAEWEAWELLAPGIEDRS